jgi:hypothetical protein
MLMLKLIYIVMKMMCLATAGRCFVFLINSYQLNITVYNKITNFYIWKHKSQNSVISTSYLQCNKQYELCTNEEHFSRQEMPEATGDSEASEGFKYSCLVMCP